MRDPAHFTEQPGAWDQNGRDTEKNFLTSFQVWKKVEEREMGVTFHLLTSLFPPDG